MSATEELHTTTQTTTTTTTPPKDIIQETPPSPAASDKDTVSKPCFLSSTSTFAALLVASQFHRLTPTAIGYLRRCHRYGLR